MLRRSVLFVMAVVLVCAVVLVAQTAATYSIPVWNGKAYEWPRLGPTLLVKNGVLDILMPPIKARTYGAQLPRTTSGTYTLPAGAANVEVFVNGMHYWPVSDYTIEAGAVKPVGTNFPPDADVRANFDQ